MPASIQKKIASADPRMGQGNEVCDECKEKTAVHFCLCAVPLRKFCDGCELSHYQKARHLTHSIHPISAYQTVASGRVSVETFKKKQLNINDFLLRIEEELVKFDTFTHQVENEFEALIAQIAAKKEQILSDLQVLRGQFTADLNKMQKTIEAKRYLEESMPLDLIDIKSLSGKLKLQGIYKLLEECITYEVLGNTVLQNKEMDIPVIKGNSLRLFNPNTFQMTQRTLSQTTRIDHGTAYCFIGADSLLAIGGNDHNEVYEINISTGKVDQAPHMNSIRWYTGIFPYKGKVVFAFGGFNGNNLNTSEKYELTSKSWINLGNLMQREKHCCSVCEHASGLYISGSDNRSSSIEHFNPIGETFRLVLSDLIANASIMCCVGDELYQIRENQIKVARLSSESTLTFTVKGTFPIIKGGWYWLFCPVSQREGELISGLFANGQPIGLFSFKPSQGQFAQVANFSY